MLLIPRGSNPWEAEYEELTTVKPSSLGTETITPAQCTLD